MPGAVPKTLNPNRPPFILPQQATAHPTDRPMRESTRTSSTHRTALATNLTIASHHRT